MTAALFHAPALFSGHRVVAVDRLPAQADEQRLAADVDDGWRRVRFSEVTVPLRLAVGLEVLEIDRAGRLPDGLAGALVEGNDVLHVDAVEVHDQQVAEEDRRRAGAAEVIALEVAPLPERLARAGVERGRTGRAVVDVDAPRFGDGRRRGVAVELVSGLRVLDREHLQVVDDLSALDI